ncbi:PAS domain-containing protein [Terricaulis sp.]|uniref:PAS domain-containing protein n=1 Tax=Terricaulis sp. TaxID=2768686 RepID=UPI003783333F
MINSLSADVLAQVLDGLPVRIFWKDRESRYLGCNKQFAVDAGVDDPVELIGKSDYYFYPPEQAKAFRDDDADVMWKGEPKVGIVEELTLTDGKTIVLETNKYPLRDQTGKVIGIIGTYQDITARQEQNAERCRACLSELLLAT